MWVRKSLSVFILMLFAMTAIANTAFTGKKVGRTFVNVSAGYFFHTIQPMENPDNCSSNTWYHIHPGTYEDAAFSVILAAVTSKADIQFNLSGCESGYPRVTWISTTQ